MNKGAFHKLSAKFYGPFEVLERVGQVAYKLKQPPTARIHNVFHVSLLKKKVGEAVSVEAQLPAINDSTEVSWEPAAIVEARLVKKRGPPAALWLIRWKGCSSESDFGIPNTFQNLRVSSPEDATASPSGLCVIWSNLEVWPLSSTNLTMEGYF